MNRKSLASQFDDTSRYTAWKTFLVEAHADGEPEAFLTDVFGKSRVTDTEDVNLFVVAATPEVSFTIDCLDKRFWSWHTTSPADAAHRIVKARTAVRRDLDFVWLPSSHLRALGERGRPRFVKTDFRGKFFVPPEQVQDLSIAVRGGDATRFVDDMLHAARQAHAISVDRVGVKIDDALLGEVDEYVGRFGVFVARGNSFALHQQVVAGVTDRYRELVTAAENLALRFDALPHGGGTVSGGALELRFGRPIPDLQLFLRGLFSSREPFRLWGVPAGDDEYAEVEAVDLHIGKSLRFEITTTWMRVHLYDGACGNTIARLVSSLQHHVDGGLTAAEPTLAAALSGTVRRAA